ncbi:CBS domain-containing protein [Roseivivax sp. THAF197b]|uniref:CBS domain-containing protein n=2 Tax=unclassified Roseivivax TaxID=2639302 RepID=UPI001C12B0DD|nr:CBS domain-containing protein [Roseivivax sp. THAF197b]
MSLSSFLRLVRARAAPGAHRRVPRGTAPGSAGIVADVMTREPVCIAPETTLAEALEGLMVARGIGLLPVVENGVLLGRLDRRAISAIDREHWVSTRANDIFVDLARDHVLSDALPLGDVFALISKTGQHKFLVAEDAHLVGVLTLSDLTEYLSAP